MSKSHSNHKEILLQFFHLQRTKKRKLLPVKIYGSPSVNSPTKVTPSPIATRTRSRQLFTQEKEIQTTTTNSSVQDTIKKYLLSNKLIADEKFHTYADDSDDSDGESGRDYLNDFCQYHFYFKPKAKIDTNMFDIFVDNLLSNKDFAVSNVSKKDFTIDWTSKFDIDREELQKDLQNKDFWINKSYISSELMTRQMGKDFLKHLTELVKTSDRFRPFNLEELELEKKEKKKKKTRKR